MAASGLRIEEAGTGSEALGKVRAAQGRYDAVVLDDDLPDYTGDSLVRELRALYSDLSIVIASSARAAELKRQFSDDRCVAVIAKPYKAGALQDTLRLLGVACPEAEK
jgi:CheY-like chemotaxis protein